MTHNLIDEIEHMGIHLSDDKESYFLHEVRETLDIIFGSEAAQIIMDPLKKRLSVK